MYRTILVPVDGSTFAEDALPWARAIARHSEAAIRLVLVHENPAYAMTPEGPVGALQSLDRLARETEMSYLDGLRHRLDAEGTEVETVMQDGTPADGIFEETRRGADLVVMTTHGRGPVSRFWLGSVADRLARRLDVPLLLVRPGKAAEPWAEGGRILVPLDGSSFSESALPAAIAMAGTLQAGLSLVRVVRSNLPETGPPYPVGYDRDLEREAMTQARTYLDEISRRLADEGLSVTATAVESGDVAGAILEEAERVGASVIAIATHGEKGVRRLLLGSVTDKVVRSAGTPVLVLPPPAVEGQTSPRAVRTATKAGRA